MVGGSVAEAMWWVVRLVGNKANLSPSSVGARVGAELGNKSYLCGFCSQSVYYYLLFNSIKEKLDMFLGT